MIKKSTQLISMLRVPTKRAVWMVTLLLVGWECGADSALAQVRMRRFGGGVMVVPTTTDSPQETSDKAILKTDAELEALLVKAERYLADGNFRIATRIWQEVMGRCGDTLYSTDGEIYYSLGRQVEQRIAKLPPDGLRTYRISADAGATEILAAQGATDRTAALNRIVNEYFLSELGDDAALELASHALDGFDFVGASRLLQRIVDDYPDPSVAIDQVWMRIAVCQAFNGNHDAAALALKEARSLATPSTGPLLDRVASEIKETAHQNVAAAQSDQFVAMRLGNSRRTGVMPALPDSVMKTDLQPMFQYLIEPKKGFREVIKEAALGSSAIGPDAVKINLSEAERTLYKHWGEKECCPTGYLLIDEQRVYYKSIADVTVWSKIQPSAEVVWRPAWLNQFVIDDGMRILLNQQNAYGTARGNKRRDFDNDSEIFFFGDHVAQSMSLHRGVLYNVEGPSYDLTDNAVPHNNPQGNFQWGQNPRRTRTNFLTAYDASTGQMLWRIPAVKDKSASNPQPPVGESDEANDMEDIGFMAAPIGYGTLLIVPVNVGGSIYIYALDSRQQGKVVWRSFLTDEPAGGAPFWSPIQLTLDGSDLFAVCGSGALFVLEPATGGVRFARRYPRLGKVDNTGREMGIPNERRIFDGWSEDAAIPYRNVIVVMASDLNAIHAYDRQDGTLKWEAPTAAESDARVSYLIGVHDDLLYAGGPNEVIAYDLKGEGRMLWSASWTAREYLKGAKAKSYGRGMITTDGVYLPIKDSILKLDLKTGKPLGYVGVRLGYEGLVGNLFSDGQKFWVVGANRLMALENVPESRTTDTAPEKSDLP